MCELSYLPMAAGRSHMILAASKPYLQYMRHWRHFSATGTGRLSLLWMLLQGRPPCKTSHRPLTYFRLAHVGGRSHPAVLQAISYALDGVF